VSVVCIYCRGEHGEDDLCLASIHAQASLLHAEIEQGLVEMEADQRKHKAKFAAQMFEIYKMEEEIKAWQSR
jgi:hypothetical protein